MVCHGQGKYYRFSYAVISILLGLAANPAMSASVTSTAGVTDLIVKFSRNLDIAPAPATVIDTVTAVTAGATGDFALYLRIGSPSDARWLIDHRLPQDYLDALRQVDPDHPELHLQEYVLLRYASVEARMAAATKLQADSGVISAIPNSPVPLSMRVNDYFVATTGPSTIPNAGYQWPLETINVMSPSGNPTATSAWDLAQGYGYIADVDTGIDPGHPDLQQNFRPHFSRSFYTSPCNPTNLTNVDEYGTVAGSGCDNVYVGHGTHVAGIIAAQPNNSAGVAGVCWYCSLLVLKVTQGGAPQTANVVNAYYTAVLLGGQIINHSGGAPGYLEFYYGRQKHVCTDLSPGTDGWCDVLSLAERRQVVVVAAAGNTNNVIQDPSFGQRLATQFPASEPNVVSVGGTVYGDTLWQNDPLSGLHDVAGTNLDKLDFVAPAKRVVSTFYRNGSYGYSWCEDADNQTTYAGETGYDECTGTSMSSPHVAGALGIVRSINPLLSRATLVTTASQTARTVAGSYKMPDGLATVQSVMSTNGSVTPIFALYVDAVYGRRHRADNRLFTTVPQMATAAIKGTMLPTLNYSTTPVYYLTDTNAPVASGYTFPDVTGAHATPYAYFSVYSRYQVSNVQMTPLYRLSKAQDIGNGFDACGFAPPISKQNPVQHIYTTSDTEKSQLMAATQGNCFNFDGIEGYIASYNWTGTLQTLYRLYNPTADSYILVPSGKLSTATALGYTQNQTSLGWVIPN